MKSVRPIKIILLLLVFLMPFAQGLYFYMAYFGIMILVVLLLGLMLVQKKSVVIHWTRGLFFLAFILLSVGTVIYGIDAAMAIIGTFKWIGYFLIYILVQQLYDKKFKDQLLQTVVYSGLTMAFLSLVLMATPLFSDFFVENGRLGGFFQYANTYGLFLLACFLLLLIGPFTVYHQFIGGPLLVVAMMMTYSRGVLFLACFSVLLLIFLKAFEDKLRFLKDKNVDGRAVKIDYKQLKIMVATVFMSGAWGIVGWLILGQQNLISRMGEHVNSSEFLSRILYYQDGIRMMLKYPLGLGHLGYHYIQEVFQTGDSYHVKFIHSNLLQISLDLGILGGILFLCFMVGIMVDRRLKWEYRFIIGTLFIHGLLDFDFQFAYIWVLVIVLATRTLDEKRGSTWSSYGLKTKSISFRSSLAVTGILYLFVFFVTFFQYTNHYDIALKIAPWYTEARIDYFRSLPREDPLKVDLAASLMASQDYFVDSFAYMRDYDYNNKDYEAALALSQTCMRLNPLEIAHIEMHSRILIELAIHSFQVGDYDESLQHLDAIKKIPDYLMSMSQSHKTEFDINNRVQFDMTKVLVENQLRADGLHNQIVALKGLDYK